MSKPTVFISYSKHDEELKNQLFKQLEASGQCEAWDDSRIKKGGDWLQAIFDAIDRGCVIVLMVSANSLTTKFILDTEIPRMLDRREAGLSQIYPIVVKPCDWEGVDWLSRMNVAFKGRPLGQHPKTEDFDQHQLDKDFAAIAKEIRLMLKEIVSPESLQPSAAEIPYTRIPTLPAPKLFVGRTEMLKEIERQFREDTAGSEVIGLISLRGMGGVGKTALAIESAYRFGSLFPGGRYWVELRGGDSASAIRKLLRDLNAAERVAPDAKLEELCATAKSILAGRRALVVLDNAETIPEKELKFLADLGTTTLVTSRTAIDTTTEISVDQLKDDEALALLAKRGVDVQADREDALKLIARMGNLALALEITSRRMAAHKPLHQSCADVLAELNESRHLVNAIHLPRRNSPEDNIAEAFALSYTSLEDDLKLVFQALGVCALSGATTEAIVAITDLEKATVRDALLRLSELSLANFGGKRTLLHPLLHDFAELQAEQQSELHSEIILRHIRYFGIKIGASYQNAIEQEEDADNLLPGIDAEQDNIRLAQVRVLQDRFDNPELAVELTNSLKFYWRLRDEPKVFDWLCHAEKLAKQVGDNLGQANVLKAIGDVQSFRKENDAALASYDDALKLFKQVGDNLGQANVLQAIGDVQSFRDEKDAALASYDDALKLFKQVGSNLGQANVLLEMAKIHGDTSLFEAAIGLYEKINHTYSIALGKAYYGDWLLDNGEPAKALPLLLAAKEAWQQINFEPGVDWMDDLLVQTEA
ncbi:MAG: TIR domain-containing protein [Blastocatellia bacterium]